MLSLSNDFGGHFDSHGGSQFLGNSFNTDGAPIYIGAGPGMSK